MTVDSWNDLFNSAGLILVALTFVAGLGALLTGRQINKRQTAELVKLQIALAEQQEKTAEAQRALLELQERARPRTVDSAARAIIIDWLQIGAQDTPVLIQFVGGSVTEPRDFAQALQSVLVEAGWKVDGPRGGPAFGSPPVGLLVRIAEVAGEKEQTQATVLHSALNKGGLNALMVRVPVTTVKAGEVELMVGLKP